MKPVVTLPPNYVYATASRISRRDFSRPFVPSCLLLTSVSFNFNPPVRILQGSTCVGLGFSFAWTVFVQAARIDCSLKYECSRSKRPNASGHPPTTQGPGHRRGLRPVAPSLHQGF